MLKIRSTDAGEQGIPGVSDSSAHASTKLWINRNGSAFTLIFAMPLLVFLLTPARGENKMPAREEGRFDIFVAGIEIGREQFSIQDSGSSVSSNSVVNFRDPGNKNRGVKIETQLSMDDKYMPRTYQVRTDIGGQKGTMKGTFVPQKATFEYSEDGVPRKSGLLVGDRYVVLDANVFHHFVFIGRLFDFANADKVQSLDVVIPQEMDSGILKISDAGTEKISIRGKIKELHHLRADSGPLLIDLWIDERRILHKIALPAKQIEVLRNP